MKKPLKLEGVRALAQAGAIQRVQVIATRDGLRVEFNDTFYVATREDRPRFFTKADTCISWLRELGITKIDEFDLTHWNQ